MPGAVPARRLGAMSTAHRTSPPGTSSPRTSSPVPSSPIAPAGVPAASRPAAADRAPALPAPSERTPGPRPRWMPWPIAEGAVLAFLLLAVFIGWLVTAPGREAKKSAAANAGRVAAENTAKAGTGAMAITEENRAREDQRRAETERAEDAIREADPDAADGVALDELCNAAGRRKPAGC